MTKITVTPKLLRLLPTWPTEGNIKFQLETHQTEGTSSTPSPLGPSPGRRLLSLRTALLQLWPELPSPDSSSLHNSHLRAPGLCSLEACFLLWGHMCWLWSPGHPSNTSGYSLFPSFQHVAPGLPTLPGLKTVLNLGGGRNSHVVLVVENPPANARDNRDVGSIPGLGRSPGGGHGNPLQYSCLENPTDRGA